MPPSASVRFGVTTAVVVCLAASGIDAQPRPTLGDSAYRGYLAVRMGSAGEYEVIAERNADKLFVPASVLKVATVAAALEHLGPEYQWVTRLRAEGPIVEGVLEGDLVVEPGGDPTWAEMGRPDGGVEPLIALARQVRARGVTNVRGDLVIDTSDFPGRKHPTDRTYGDLPYRFGTPTSALAVDEATITVRVEPGATVGQPALVRAPFGVDVINDTVTVDAARQGAGTLDFVPVWGTSMLVLRGEYPISEAPFVVSASDPTPEIRAGRRLLLALREAGLAVRGEVRVRAHRAATRGDRMIVAEIRSRPLSGVLKRILTRSDNWYADMLTLTLAHEAAVSGRFEDGVRVISDFVRDLLREVDAASPADIWIQDGSGLSASNLLTPAAVVRVLGYALDQPWGALLVDALARPGQGSLAAWRGIPPVAAKTGTLRHTVALAGILDPGSDSPVLFCYFINHHPERRRAARREVVTAVDAWRAGAPRR